MRGKLRKVKDKLRPSKRKDSVVDTLPTDSCESDISEQASFLGLPAEIRNEIYQYLASSTTLLLSPASPKKRPSPVGLLLACRQTWEEYRAILMTQATLVTIVADYNFNVVVRTFEKLNERDLSFMKLNPQLWIYLQLAHVPGREDRRALKGWCDYRHDTTSAPYFGANQRLPADLMFQYDVRFANNIRPPRPASRYLNGYQMKFDIVRAHLRMANNLQPPEEDPNLELKKIRADLDECVQIFQRLSTGSTASES